MLLTLTRFASSGVGESLWSCVLILLLLGFLLLHRKLSSFKNLRDSRDSLDLY